VSPGINDDRLANYCHDDKHQTDADISFSEFLFRTKSERQNPALNIGALQ